MFHIIPDNFLSHYLLQTELYTGNVSAAFFAIMEHQFSFGVEREVLVDELEFYFGQENAAQLVEEESKPDGQETQHNGIAPRKATVE